jgi:Tfp pilus assembly protein PilF
MEKFLNKSLSVVLYSILLIFPFFFLNSTQEYFITNKIYLLGFGLLLMALISTLKVLLSKKVSWKKQSFDSLILFFLMTLTISTVFSSPNKIQALLNPSFGLVMMISLTILYFYLSRISINFYKFLQISALFLSVLTIVFFFQPFKNLVLPQNFAFLKNPTFSPLGSQLDLAIFLGFFVVLGIMSFMRNVSPASGGTRPKWIPVFTGMTLIINILALSLTIYSLIKPGIIILPPFRLSWFAGVEILKNPQTALVGIGLDNFNSIFTRVKDFSYNQSPLWQINSFNVSRSAVLQIFTEAGILGLFAFGLLVFSVFKQLVIPSKEGIQKISLDSRLHGNDKTFICLFVYLVICLLIFPTSLIVWFLFFVMLGLITNSTNSTNSTDSTDLTNLLPIYLGIVVIAFGLIALSAYLLGRTYASEYYFKKSLDGIVANSAKQVYDNQRQAIILNPYIERFRNNFAQTNLLIANNLAQKDVKDITENDRQTMAQAIQAAIAEGKAVISLNPQRADGWQNLALIYLNVINAAQGADVWTISSYQRAILLDPQNPAYRLGLGGVYYSMQRYDDALKFFEQAIALKADWPNANYNYAWANFQKGNYSQAVNAMQNTLNLLNPKFNKADYEKVKKELEEFKKKLTNQEALIKKSGEADSTSLNLPTPPATQISPKLELPKDSAAP